MSENPFEPPQSDVTDPNDEPSGSIVRGVLFGGAVDIIGTVALGIVLGIAFAASAGPSMPEPQDVDALGNAFTRAATGLDTIWGMLSFVVGLSLSALGGYVCAGHAGPRWRVATLILGALMALFSGISAAGMYTFGENLGLSALTAAIIFLGGWLRMGSRQQTL
ncbi:MAG: hypothetical protein ACI8PT_001870 [Gammaproteobacteria bacterium]|jgi:hypothetical protein